jgi:hypothetical protein
MLRDVYNGNPPNLLVLSSRIVWGTQEVLFAKLGDDTTICLQRWGLPLRQFSQALHQNPPPIPHSQNKLIVLFYIFTGPVLIPQLFRYLYAPT